MQTIDTQDSVALANMPLFSMANMDSFEAEIRESERHNSLDRIAHLQVQIGALENCSTVKAYKSLWREYKKYKYLFLFFAAYSVVLTFVAYAWFADNRTMESQRTAVIESQ